MPLTGRWQILRISTAAQVAAEAKRGAALQAIRRVDGRRAFAASVAHLARGESPIKTAKANLEAEAEIVSVLGVLREANRGVEAEIVNVLGVVRKTNLGAEAEIVSVHEVLRKANLEAEAGAEIESFLAVLRKGNPEAEAGIASVQKV